ncbi:hypothetical protein EYF80_038999 [Liparis tanakae]|uniref:Uncharacterized protein n=1 Tax=Liparis tanakae TaxID=230148 RepID=A0A4Z2GAZ9_9TELE|nr:hypothetical protein EYF80_038999 [Liparis tanakae]
MRPPLGFVYRLRALLSQQDTSLIDVARLQPGPRPDVPVRDRAAHGEPSSATEVRRSFNRPAALEVSVTAEPVRPAE